MGLWTFINRRLLKMRSFFSKKGVIHTFTISGQDYSFAFYPISVGKLALLRDMGSTIVKALMSIFDKESEIKNPRGKHVTRTFGSDGSETVYEPVSAEQAAAFNEIQEQNISRLFEALLSPANLNTVALLLIDSMRDEFKRPTNESDVESLIQNCDIEYLTHLLVGFVKAHKEVFSPLGKMLGLDRAQRFNDLKSKIDGLTGGQTEPQKPSKEDSSQSASVEAHQA